MMTGIEADKLEPGNRVFWNDPDEGECSREYLIERIEHCGDMVRITEPDGSELQCFIDEIECVERDTDDGLEMSDDSCGECGHPYKRGDETHYPECSRIDSTR